jgi:uncharacterized protein (TIGR02452 family)
MMFQDRKRAYEYTQMICNAGNLKHIPVNKSEKYYYNTNFDAKVTDNKPVVKVMPDDCLEIAYCFVSYGYNPVVLNMSDISWPGGQINMGGYAQEESLFCRSNYFKTLNLQTGFYPISGPECIYSKDVFVFRDTDLTMLHKPFYVSFIACAAVKEPVLEKGELTEQDYEMNLKKVKTIFQTAYVKGHDVLVLSAFGCGAYKNPQKQMIEIFNKCIEEYGDLFKFIVFAVIPKKEMDGRYILRHNHECNYQAFLNGINKSEVNKE